MLVPGGRLLIADIMHHAEYRAVLADLGLQQVEHPATSWKTAVLGIVSFGAFSPRVLIGRKPAR